MSKNLHEIAVPMPQERGHPRLSQVQGPIYLSQKHPQSHYPAIWQVAQLPVRVKHYVPPNACNQLKVKQADEHLLANLIPSMDMTHHICNPIQHWRA